MGGDLPDEELSVPQGKLYCMDLFHLSVRRLENETHSVFGYLHSGAKRDLTALNVVGNFPLDVSCTRS